MKILFIGDSITRGSPGVTFVRLVGAAWLSRKRRLRLTIDGLHLNHAGARVFAALPVYYSV